MSIAAPILTWRVPHICIELQRYRRGLGKGSTRCLDMKAARFGRLRAKQFCVKMEPPACLPLRHSVPSPWVVLWAMRGIANSLLLWGGCFETELFAEETSIAIASWDEEISNKVKEDRCGETDGINAVENAAVAFDDGAEVLHTGIALDGAHHQPTGSA